LRSKKTEDSCRHRGAKIMTRSVTTRRLVRLRANLTERDRQIISTLVRVRVATAAQLELLHFGDVAKRRVRRSLASLTDRRVLARLPKALGRTIGGPQAGSSGHVYVLDVAGQRLASLVDGGRVRRPWALGATFLDHSLGVTEVYVCLVLAERDGSLAVRQFVGEPGTWRSFLGAGGARLVLKPDAYVVLQVGGHENYWFLEVDLGTEHAPTISHKCDLYRSYWVSGTEDERTGVFPRVLWLVPDQRRAEVIRGVIRRQPEEGAELFDVALLSAVVERVLRGAAP
jgi:hypothetical protein